MGLTSDEHGVLTARVHLEVDSTLRENRRGTRADVDLGEARTVLDQNTAAKRRIDREVDLGSARVSVGRVHAAGTKETDGCRIKLVLGIFG